MCGRWGTGERRGNELELEFSTDHSAQLALEFDKYAWKEK